MVFDSLSHNYGSIFLYNRFLHIYSRLGNIQNIVVYLNHNPSVFYNVYNSPHLLQIHE